MKKRWLFWLLIIAFVWFVISRFTELASLITTLQAGRWQWVVIAALLQVLFYVFFTAIYQAAFKTVEVESTVDQLFPLTFVAIFVNVIAPAGGATGAAVFIDDAARRGQPPVRTAAGILLSMIANLLTFSLVLFAALIFLFTRHTLEIYQLLGTLALLVFIGGLSSTLLLGLWSPERLLVLLSWIQRAANQVAAWLRRPPFLDETWSERTGTEFIEAALAISLHPKRLIRTLSIALFSHLVDLASLYALFIAFHAPVRPGVVISGYAMAILFWVVAITPQGIGVVEGAMALVFASLGVPMANSAIIALAFRGLTFWLPFFAGFLLLHRASIFGGQVRTHTEAWSVRIVAILTALTGVMNVISAVTPVFPSRLQTLARISPLEVRHGGRLTAALAGFALLLLATNLWRRKRMAWIMTLIVLVISAISHLIKGLNYEEAAMAGALAVALVYLRPHFHARSDPPSIQQGLKILAAALVFTLVYGITGFFLLDHQFKQSFNLVDAARQTIIMFTQFYDPGLQPITGLGRFFADSIYIVGATTLGYALLMVVRPVLIRHPATTAEQERARQIVEAYGCTALARLTLMPDKAYFFSPGGSVIAYTTQGRFAITLGDPIGPGDDTGPAIAAFHDFCARNDWAPAYYQVLPDYLGCYRKQGYSILPIGQEGIVDWVNFSLEGRANKGLRSGYNRIKRLGYRAETLEPPLPDTILHQIQEVSDEWLTRQHGTEKRFSVGWFDPDYICNTRTLVVYNPAGEIDAFATLLPEYQKNEVSVDLMRHRSTENGLMDYLFVEMFLWAQENGYSSFNLGLSALSGIGKSPEDPAMERAIHYIYEHVNQFYNFKGLHEFKEKFHPTWSLRYIIFPSLTSLPLVTIALIRADSGDNWFESYLREI